MTPADAPPETPPRGPATRTLIWMNLGAFFLTTLAAAGGFSWINSSYGLVPSRLSADFVGESIKLVTSLFIHDGSAHLVWNLLFLYFFGRKIEQHLGTTSFVLFYLTAGVLGGVANFLVAPQNPIPLVGASGAVSGLMGARLVLLPTEARSFSRTLLFGAILFWFAVNLIASLISLGDSTSDTAFFAHLGGFTAGLLLIRMFGSPTEEATHTTSTPADRGEPYVANAPIFRKEEHGPFWRHD